MRYRAYNMTRKEYIEGPFKALGPWLAALLCNDFHSHTVGRWCGDRVVIQSVDAIQGRQCYISASAHRMYDDITPASGLTEA